MKKNTKIQRYEIKETFECQKRQGSTSPVLIKDHISSFTLSKEIFECQYYQIITKSLSIWYMSLCVSDIFIEGVIGSAVPTDIWLKLVVSH